MTTTGPNRVSFLRDGVVSTQDLDPREYGFKGASIAELLGDDAPTNAAILRGILCGDIRDAKRDVVLLNASAAMMAGGLVDNLADGIKLAAETIDSGAAVAKLDALIAYSREFTVVQ